MSIRPLRPQQHPVLRPIAASGGVALDPALRLAELSGPTAIRGTISLPNLDHWTLELAKWEATFTPILTLGGNSTPQDSATLATFDPVVSQIPNGFYRLRLTAVDKSGKTTLDEIYVGVDSNPRSKEIDLPLGAAPVGIAIEPAGNYAYVSDARPYQLDQHSTNGTSNVASEHVSRVYVIDINPASPSYNQLVETIQLVKSDPLPDGSQPQVANPNGLIAPDGLAEIAVTPDGLQLDVAAPNFTFDPTSGVANPNFGPSGDPFAHLPGNLIQINLTPQPNNQPPEVKSIIAIPAGDETFGVAIEPQAAAAQSAVQSGQPIQYQVAFTNAHTDAFGVEVLDPASSTKKAVPLDLNPNDLQSPNPIKDYVNTHLEYALTQWLQVHNAGGIAFTPDGQYAFVAGRADQVTTVGAAISDGEGGTLAAPITGYLDQMLNPLFEDGNVAIIKNPLGDPNDPNPAKRPIVVGAMRPIPDGFPVDLALAPPDAAGNQFLYVSYQGLPTSNGAGGVFIFNATAMIQEVDALSKTPAGSLLLDQFAVDDLVGSLQNVKHAPNTTIDIKADYRSNYVIGDPKDPVDASVPIFGVFDDPKFAPIALGGFPGGIAIANPVPHPVVYQHLANEGGSGTPGDSLVLGVDLTPTNSITFAPTKVDPITGNVTTVDGDFYFSIDVKSTVTLYLKGNPDPSDPTAPAPEQGLGSVAKHVTDPQSRTVSGRVPGRGARPGRLPRCHHRPRQPQPEISDL